MTLFVGRFSLVGLAISDRITDIEFSTRRCNSHSVYDVQYGCFSLRLMEFFISDGRVTA